jgi:DNA-binding transcriptional MerR regulator
MPDKKMFYSIREVSDILGVRDYVLRYWETEFPQISPKKGRGGRRMYVSEDIALLKRIYDLLYVQKFTIEGARRVLSQENSPSAEKQMPERLGEIKGELEDILKLLQK